MNLTRDKSATQIGTLFKKLHDLFKIVQFFAMLCALYRAKSALLAKNAKKCTFCTLCATPIATDVAGFGQKVQGVHCIFAKSAIDANPRSL